MRFKLLALLLLPAAAPAAEVARTDCAREGARASCRIVLDGEVKPGERLFLSRVHDRDTLFSSGHTLGSTGSFLGRAFHAGFFPRVYPLEPLRGERNAVLSLEAQGGLLHPAGLPAGTQVKVIDESYPLWRILGPAASELLSFLFLLNLGAYALLRLRRRGSDGWVYPREETRWFLGALCAYLLLRHEVAELSVPLLWSARAFVFAQRAALVVMLWSATILLLGGRFSDRSSIERSPSRAPGRLLHSLAHAALVVALAAIAFFPSLGERQAALLLGAPLLPLALAQERALRALEWRRVLKRSALPPLFFHLGLIALPSAALVTASEAWLAGAGDQRFLEGAGWAALLLAGFRLRSQHLARERGQEQAAECRGFLQEFSASHQRLQALCDYIADEWGAARVSVISVDEETGLVLNSAGPEAIPDEGRISPRRLGPFLRRVCKHERMLYAPVAEELGHDLQSQGLKHSSLAIPLRQDGQVRAVLCMMADEGQRIPPGDAAALEMLTDLLSLEVLSAVAQSVAENRNRRLLEIARTADALAVESLDHWGHARVDYDAASRVVLGGDCIPAGPFLDQLRKSPLLGPVLAAFRAETRATWTALASSFEFIPKDNRDDFWVISPRSFRNPMLAALGPERVAVLLSSVLERQARALTAKPAYAVLGYCGVRLVSAAVGLRRSGWHGAAVELDSDDFTLLLDLRQKAPPGTVLHVGDAPALAKPEQDFQCRVRAWEDDPTRPIFSILFTCADKKETRRLENAALDKARGYGRKAG